MGAKRAPIDFRRGATRLSADGSAWARRSPQHTVCRVRTGVHGLLIRPFATVPLTQEIHEGAVSPIQGWASPGFGLRQPAPAVTYSASTRLPLRILTLLLPTVDPAGVPPAVALLLDGAGR